MISKRAHLYDIYFGYVQLEILNTGALEYINRECYANAMFCYVKMFCKSGFNWFDHPFNEKLQVCLCVYVCLWVYEWCEIDKEMDRERWGRGRKSKRETETARMNENKKKKQFFSDKEMKNYKCGEMLFIDQCTHEKDGLKLYYAKL